MSLNKLELRYFRNIKKADFSFSDTFNIIVGNNGAGKTNILESIYYLSLSRSFRTSQTKKLIQFQENYLQVIGYLKDSFSGADSILGIRKSVADSQIKINGEMIKQLSRLAVTLPVQVIHPQGHQLLEQGPKQRRQFLDWGVFHVEPVFLSIWHAYTHTLKQRNAALRQGQATKFIQLWDKGLLELGEKMTFLRKQYLNSIQPYISKYCLSLMKLEIAVEYRCGWAANTDFESALNNGLEFDRRSGFTRCGPHRADLIFNCDNNRVQDYLSRGQQKLLVCALRLAQIKLLKKQKQQDVVLLIDDVAAELDEQHREKLINTALETGAQIFVSTNQLDLLKFNEKVNYKVFHVEHGQVSEMVQSPALMERKA